MDPMPEVGIQWKRPTTIFFPNVWRRFESKPKNGKIYKIRIEEITDDRVEEILELLLKYYIPEEPLSVSAKLVEDEISVMVYHHLWTQIIQEHISIIAVIDEDTPTPKIVGVQILSVASKHDPSLPEVPGKAMQKMKKIYYDIRKNCNPFDVLNADKYLHEWGLCVVPEFRGCNVGFNILLSLRHIAQAFDLTGSFIMFTRIESQILATRVGFKPYVEIVYSEYKDEHDEIVFPVVGTRSLKFMGIKYP